MMHKLEILIAERYGIRVESARAMLQDGVIRENEIRNILLKNEYEEKAKQGRKIILRHELADKYCVSVSLVEKVIFNT